MRLRLGLLQDAKAIEKQAAREATEAHAKKQKLEIPTAKTEAQTKADEAAAIKAKEKGIEKFKVPSIPRPRIRPLSESKAIDSGATFVSEGFLFLVGISLILLENWRSRRKETSRREDVADRISELEESEKSARTALVELEKEILRLRARDGREADSNQRILPRELWDVEGMKEEDQPREPQGWFSWIRSRSQANVHEVASAAKTIAGGVGENVSKPDEPSTKKAETVPTSQQSPPSQTAKKS